MSEILKPLSPATPRPEIHSRLVTPLVTLCTAESVQQLREINEKTDIFFEEAGFVQDRFDEGGSFGNYAKDISWHILLDGFHKTDDALAKYRGRPYIANWQYYRMKRAIFGSSIAATMLEGCQAHVNTALRIALPAYMAAKKGLTTENEIEDETRRIGVTGITAILEEKDYIKGLQRMALTASSLYGPMQLDYLETENIFETSNHLEHIAEAPPVTVFTMFEMQDGSIVLSNRMKNILKQHLHYRNHILSPEDYFGNVPGPSKGCPVIYSSTRLLPDDLESQQWEDLTGGADPIADYNEATQKLTYNRTAFDMVHRLIVDVIGGRVSVA